MRAFDTIGPGDASALIPPFSTYPTWYYLTANTAKTVTWPQGAQFCNIFGANDYYVRAGGVAAVPSTSDITDGTASALNPSQRQRAENENTFSIISATTGGVSIEFWGASTS